MVLMGAAEAASARLWRVASALFFLSFCSGYLTKLTKQEGGKRGDGGTTFFHRKKKEEEKSITKNFHLKRTRSVTNKQKKQKETQKQKEEEKKKRSKTSRRERNPSKNEPARSDYTLAYSRRSPFCNKY